MRNVDNFEPGQEFGLGEGCGCIASGLVGCVAVPGLFFFGAKVTGHVAAVDGGGIGALLGIAAGVSLAYATFVIVRKIVNSL
jgi:hypothetical protein